MRRYTAHGRLMEDTEPDMECFFVHYSDAQDSISKLRGELSLAEEGLASYAQELQHIRSSLLEIAEGRPMSAMTRRALRKLAGLAEHPEPGHPHHE